MPELPLEPLTVAVYERLTGDDGQGLGIGETVHFAGAKDAEARYVALDLPDAQPRETFNTEGHTVILAVRCHTEHAVGDATPLDAMQLAGSVQSSLDGAPLDIGPDHALLHLPTPELNPVRYDVDEATDAYDVTVRYDIMTQHLK
jgi:hypothetical protein